LQLSKKVEDVKNSIKDLRDNPLLGGWESICCRNITSNGEFYNVQLTTRNRRREKHHKFVSDRRDYEAIRNEVILSLLNFLDDRFDADEVCVTKLRPLGQLDPNVTDAELEQCHGCIIPDMSLAQFALQYKDAAKNKDLVELKTVPDLLKRVLACGADMYVLSTALARFISAKPHSADVDRLIRSYNIIKTADRSSLTGDTLKHYLYIRHNMPVVSKFDPRPAVIMWLNDKERRQVIPQKAKRQRWFNSMFETGMDSDSDNDNDEKRKHLHNTQSDRIDFKNFFRNTCIPDFVYSLQNCLTLEKRFIRREFSVVSQYHDEA
jgi:hypothetical protein